MVNPIILLIRDQKDISPIIVRNIKALKKLADMEGLSVVDLIKLLKNE